ncbi:NmrA family NAD(P)-binding protein [Halalkaliarchaeum sp. AArc-GB]|uniref:NmrA family NAD(P)-binding protein n=1 Tax=Halalkaliarchaeum sp. AArc-GB TaxID=3074078 RepID=UPI002857FD74|nr:NmrA family NAD(P)-binding protein [Halalkaliarchaeum sp. AArc-GB]MDR5673678.1 NmrA family NAD(P)-binding protein [Halalkaliarchaeum sp. AArc-GB]
MSGDRTAGETILVTGATGTVGGAVCEELAGDQGPSGRTGGGGSTVRAGGGGSAGRFDGGDLTIRAATRSPGAFDGAADEVVRFDFTDPTTWRAAFAGVDALFLVRPPAISRVRRDLLPALSAAIGAGVERVVFLSVIGADRNPIVPHARIESWLAESGVDATFLRASFFMQNLLEDHREEIRDGQLFVPAGSGKTSFVDARDVAAVGVTALREGTDGDVRAYDLTGPAALGYTEVADLLTRELGREVQYVDPSVIRFLWRRIRAGEGFGKAAVMAGIYTTARLGLADRVTDDVRRVLGREPRGLSAFVREHRDAWG